MLFMVPPSHSLTPAFLEDALARYDCGRRTRIRALSDLGSLSCAKSTASRFSNFQFPLNFILVFFQGG
jgi:hypothetical protein